LVDIDASHSRDEHSVGGCADHYEEILSEDDGHFTGDFAPTPVLPLCD
jgi:hypothetical protein